MKRTQQPKRRGTEEAQLKGFLAKYSPGMAALGKGARARLRALLPGAYGMVYDNYNGLVMGYGASERPSEAVLSVMLYADHANLFFLRGAFELKDPKKLLKGSGKRVRHLRLDAAERLDDAEVRDLISQALAITLFRPNPDEPGRLIIKAIAAKQRPRRPS